jgi:hypothetical protein
MNIFDIISDILFYKKKNCLTTVDEEQEFSPYLVNRWLSMYSPLVVKHCNFINKYQGIFESKKSLYSLFMAIFPKMPYKKINYFKKTKEDKDSEKNELINKISHNMELSTREIKQYISVLNS